MILMKETLSKLQDFEGKTIAYFNGSFDPFHLGHEHIINTVLAFVDYVLIYVIDGQSPRKPHRLSKDIRQEMVDSVYGDHPQVFISHLDAYQLQQSLSAIGNATFVAIVGDDVIGEVEKHPEIDAIYLRGTPLKSSEGNTSQAAMKVVCVEEFLVCPRHECILPEKLCGMRPLTILEAPSCDISSADVRRALQKGQSIEHLVPQSVEHIIRREGLYL